ncbi:glycosyl hydrolase family 18 protein [Pedobacter hiemivivus]|uniref:chitinase n=1 Tax=Pedobacter hiemivivus TaxID=2530454 RepID=A0A4R0MLT4_9SPHI|nr:glycosyl hydrolase family 18 protein [Pedobacter hiemivivus]TCC87132.1 hypothetical protein EZ444_23050 [Pedobacter hiemivivus]
MKKIIYLIFPLLVFMLGCKKDKVESAGDFHPRIFDGGLVFQSPSRIIKEGESAVYNRLQYSPAPGAKMKVSWKVDGKEVSTDTAFTFTPTAGGEYVIKLEATFNGQTATRLSKVLVSPTTYTPKPSPFVNMSYLSDGGVAANVNWVNVTHVAFNGARVLPEGGVDFSKGNQNQNLDEIVARGHIAGVPVLLGVSGRLSGVDGWSLYASSDFGSVITDVAKRAQLVQTLVTYVADRRLDGIDVMMTDLGGGDVSASLAAVGPFVSELKAALPAGKLVTATVTVNYLHWDYTDLSKVDWVNVHAFEDGNHVGPGATLGQQSSLNWMISGAGIWRNKGFAANKIVLGMPAFGLRYLELDGNGNNLSWGSYNYLPFKDILKADPTAVQKEFTGAIAKGVYFNGIPLVTQKANYIKQNGFKGAYLWAGDYDGEGDNSLMKAISQILK